MSTVQTPRQRFLLLCLVTVLLGLTYVHMDIILYCGYSAGVSAHVQELFTNNVLPVRRLEPPALQRWQPVTTSHDAYVFSAYLERKSFFREEIRIVGALRSSNFTRNELYCLLWYEGSGREPQLVRAKVTDMKATHLRLTSVFFLCPTRGINVNRRNSDARKGSVPSFVSLTDVSNILHPLNMIPVHVQSTSPHRFNLTACVSPMFVGGSEKHLVEWIEVNKILGVELFTIYVHNVSNSDMNILKYYESKKIVEIINWTLSTANARLYDPPLAQDLDYLAQMAAGNDCLYRNKGRATFTMNTDLDEFIVPKREADFTLLDMLHGLPNRNVYCFLHSFHGDVDVDHDIHPALQPYKHLHIEMIAHFQRHNELHKPGIRSKLIYKAGAVVITGIHNTWEPDKRYQHVVDPETAILHHYRGPDIVTDKAILHQYKGPVFVIDRATEKYLETALYRINLTVAALGIWPASRGKGPSDITNSVDPDQPTDDVNTTYT